MKEENWNFAIRLLDKEIEKETDPERRQWLAEIRHSWVAERRLANGY